MEEFNRLEILLPNNDFKDKTVLIVGIGGVGGYAVEALARSNIGKLILVDFDKVDITNINRQIIALHSTIGKNKTEVFKERIKDININCEVVIYNEFLNEENIENIMNNKIDFVVDAIDSIKSKELLIKTCLEKNIPFISSMGTGNRLDPSKLLITTLDKTNNDPLARILRKWVKDNKIKGKIKVVTSTEVPKKTNSNIIGSNSFVPPSAGLLIASEIINSFYNKKV